MKTTKKKVKQIQSNKSNDFKNINHWKHLFLYDPWNEFWNCLKVNGESKIYIEEYIMLVNVFSLSICCQTRHKHRF